ncbi:4-hydroxyacetophenone monooxygenase [Gammaproteobacteria bacterium 42_54_T18]|nr:4-hydroxyacetophenone monooxygenase [Gammaproteobacteria bacterium 42_54_T18]
MNTINETINNNATPYLDVAVVGAGFGGIGLGIKLKQAGVDNFRIFEQASDVGGVWRDNIYPGAACDVPSHLYSFSFEPNPEWKNMFGGQEEIYAYLQGCTKKYGLDKRIQYETTICAAEFDEVAGLWTLTDSSGKNYLARTCVMAVGALNVPSKPAFKGMDDFSGKIMHTAEWDPRCDLIGKNVAVIGTGASAIQVVPNIQPRVKKLTLFQRTPPWVLPKLNRKIAAPETALYKNIPFLQSLYRKTQYALFESFYPLFLWNTPASKVLDTAGRACINAQIKNPELRKKVTPGYRLGCKRVLLASNYYPTLTKENVEVVANGVKEINASGIVDSDGVQHDLDAIVLATGFKVPTAGAPFPITGKGGRLLSQDWKQLSEGYKGIAVSGYPNLLFIMGPNTGPGNTSVIFFIEAQLNYITKYIATLNKKSLRYMDLQSKVQTAFNKKIQKKMENTAWTSGCQSWYLTDDGKNSTLWPSFSADYYLQTLSFDERNYTRFTLMDEGVESLEFA